MAKEPLTTGEVAEYCHVTYRAVLKWIAEGKLKAYRTPGQHSRVSVNDFLDFLEKYHMPVPNGLQRTAEKPRILVVDDDRKIVQLVKKALEADERYEISTAYDGFTAGQKFCRFHPEVVVLDIMMPGLNGYDVCTTIRSDPANKDVKGHLAPVGRRTEHLYDAVTYYIKVLQRIALPEYRLPTLIGADAPVLEQSIFFFLTEPGKKRDASDEVRFVFT